MSDMLRPITDRSRRAYLSETEAMAVEWRRASWAEIVAEREERLQRELRDAQRTNERLSAENATLSTRVAAQDATIEQLAAQALRDRERLATAECWLSVGMIALALATGAAVVWAVTIWH